MSDSATFQMNQRPPRHAARGGRSATPKFLDVNRGGKFPAQSATEEARGRGRRNRMPNACGMGANARKTAHAPARRRDSSVGSRVVAMSGCRRRDAFSAQCDPLVDVP